MMMAKIRKTQGSWLLYDYNADAECTMIATTAQARNLENDAAATETREWSSVICLKHDDGRLLFH